VCGPSPAAEPHLEEELTNLSSTRRRTVGLARNLALALALAGGAVMLAAPGFTAAAYAQKKKGEPKSQFSKEFVAAYRAAEGALNAPNADIATIKPQLLAMIPLAVNADEQQALGGLIYNAGAKGGDQALQLQGMEMMLASGKVAPDQLGRFNFTAYQLANLLKDYPKSRRYLQAAIDNNFTTERISLADLEITMAESYFSEGLYAEGLKYLGLAIADRKAKGQQVDAQWYRRGIAVAYTNRVVPQIYDLVVQWVGDYPAEDNWRDAINLTRNLNDYEGPELLDLLRLSRKAGVLKDKTDYIFYIEAADARRLPKEVKDVIDQAYATGLVSKDDIFVADSLATANSRIKTDMAELPVLERDANAASAGLRTVLAAGDTFLSYGEYAKAAGFYQKSLGMAGVDRNTALTRLGIAQVGMGDFAAAQATLAQVGGSRMPIAKLWSAYAAKQSAAAAPASGS
jgi:tetratricopeptide (TPR) repeat protein